ncbi:MAG: sensor histidine kinase, partial [Armatimonadetes bacterium]|nr:sensor histidine kinase [Armatimonadota bacterium]
ILIAARRYEHGAAFREDEVALLQAAASLLSLGLDKPVGGTALIAAEPRVEEWIIQAERLRAAMDVARGVAHYLGNKLGVLVAKIERTAAASRDKAVREGLRAALDVADEVGECLRKLQVISWRPAEQLAGRVDLSEVVSRATDLVLEKRRSWLGSNADQFHVDIQVCEQVEAEGNFDRLVDAFAAILDNALDAMPQGGKVEVSIGAAGCWAWVRLIDTGIGFPQHFGERVFAPFFSTKGPSAMGLGLTLAWAVVAKHGGHMLICSQLQKGTAVAVYLPRSFDQER